MDHNHHNTQDLQKTQTLYIEDDPVAFEVVKSFLNYLCEIDWAMNGEIALQKTSEKKYQLILMDIHLPRGLNGIELVQHFRKDLYYSKIPIIAVTAYAMAGEREDILKSGCDDYISKPFTKKLLLEIISNYTG